MFHKSCGDKKPTLIIIKSEFGRIFGGYTDLSWAADGAGRHGFKKG